MRRNRNRLSIVGSLCTICLLVSLGACSSLPSSNQTTSQTTASGTSTAGTSTQQDQIAQAVFHAVNQSRAANGLASLTWSSALARSAGQHDVAMQAANTLSHQLPGEAALGDRESQQGVQWLWAAENIGETSEQSVQGALGLHQAMMNERPPEDGHRQNILTTIGTMIGIAVLIDQQHGKLWLTEDFAAASV